MTSVFGSWIVQREIHTFDTKENGRVRTAIKIEPIPIIEHEQW